MILGFNNEDKKEIIESGEQRIGVMLLRIPINLFSLSQESRNLQQNSEIGVCN